MIYRHMMDYTVPRMQLYRFCATGISVTIVLVHPFTLLFIYTYFHFELSMRRPIFSSPCHPDSHPDSPVTVVVVNIILVVVVLLVV